MVTRPAVRALLVLLCSGAFGQKIHRSPEIPRFMGREVVITEPETEIDGFFPKGPASICVEGPPAEQCYTAPKDLGRWPSADLIYLKKNMPALLFSADSGGVSGFRIGFALLQPGSGDRL